MNLSFNLCTIKQLNTLVKISRETFVNAFEKENNPIDFYNYVNSAFNEETLKKELSNINMSFYFLYLNEVLAGYFKLNERDAQNETFKTPSIELERIYVIPKFQGKKLGETMLNKAVQISKEKQATFLWLGVWEKNVNAIRFYERYGFKQFSSHDFYVGNDKQIDLLMKLELRATSSSLRITLI